MTRLFSFTFTFMLVWYSLLSVDCGAANMKHHRLSMTGTGTLPPGRGKWPLFGDTFQLINAKTMASYQVRSRERFGDVWKTSIFFKNTIFITGTDNLKTVFVEEAKKKTEAFFPPHHKKLFGENSLLVQSGPYHAKLRRVIQQSLSPQAIAQLEGLIQQNVQQFISECRQTRGTGSFKFAEASRRFFIRLAVAILLGDDISKTDLETLSNDVSTWSKGLLSAPLTFIPWSTASRAMRARKRVASKIATAVESYQAARQSGSGISKNNLLFRLVTTLDDVDNDFLSTEAIIDNIFTLIFAGSDTTASAMTSIVKTLSANPSLQDALRNAVRESASPNEGDAAVRIDALIQEVFASNPPAPFSMRLVGNEPLVLSNGVEVPPNWLVAYGYAGTLLGEGLSAPTSSSSDKNIAFGGGPRMCPGRFLAIKELKLLVFELLGSNGFQWTLEKDQNLDCTYTPGYFPIDGLKINVV